MAEPIFVIHENSAWVEPLRTAFSTRSVTFHEWFLAHGTVDLAAAPPHGVFYNRMSASAHTRGHRFAPERTAVVLDWLHQHDRRVLNGRRALHLEVSKAAQYTALQRSGIQTPQTLVAVGRKEILAAAEAFGSEPIILKPNRGGTGRGVQRFDSARALRRHILSDAFDESPDGISLLQEYIHSPDQCITRVEFVGGDFLYAVQVYTSGSFELCPADPCVTHAGSTEGPRFDILPAIDPGIILQYHSFLKANDIHIAAIEFVRDREGSVFTYDVNTNTNYNADAEQRAGGRRGMDALADFLLRELRDYRDGTHPSVISGGDVELLR